MNHKYLFFIIFSIRNISCKCYNIKKNKTLDIENNNNISKNNKKKDKEDDKYNKDNPINDKENDKNKGSKINNVKDFYENILLCLNNKKLFFSKEERNNNNFKKFTFLKNCDKNKNNRCWFITSVMCYLNVPAFQEIILNNNFDDNKYLKSLQKLCLEMRSKNNTNEYINFDELYNIISTDLNKVGEFFYPLDLGNYEFENLIYNKLYTSYYSLGMYSFKYDDVKNRNLEEIVVYDIFDILRKNLNIDYIKNYNFHNKFFNNNLYYSYSFQKGGLFLFFFEDKDCYEKFLDLLNYKFETILIKEKEVIKNYDNFIKKKKEIYNEIKNSFDFQINSISIFINKNHFFSICKNPEDDNWYNFNSLDNKNGDIFEFDDDFKNRHLQKENENTFFITIKRKSNN